MVSRAVPWWSPRRGGADHAGRRAAVAPGVLDDHLHRELPGRRRPRPGGHGVVRGTRATRDQRVHHHGQHDDHQHDPDHPPPPIVLVPLPADPSAISSASPYGAGRRRAGCLARRPRQVVARRDCRSRGVGQLGGPELRAAGSRARRSSSMASPHTSQVPRNRTAGAPARGRLRRAPARPRPTPPGAWTTGTSSVRVGRPPGDGSAALASVAPAAGRPGRHRVGRHRVGRTLHAATVSQHGTRTRSDPVEPPGWGPAVP